jgi:hypothetical protein
LDFDGIIKPQQDLFSVGANSRTIVLLQALVEMKFGVEIGLPQLFDNSSVEKIATLIENELRRKTEKEKEADKEREFLQGIDFCPNFAPEFKALEDGRTDENTFQKCFDQKSFSVIKKGIFLSGVSGYLGSHLFRLLVEKVKDKGIQINILLRSKEKFLSVMKRYFPDFDPSAFTITYYYGSITDDLLGLKEQEYERLASSVDCVVHLAALVKHAAVDSSLSHEEVNVKGSINMCKLALAANASFHYASTTGVGGLRSNNSKLLEFTEDCPPQTITEGTMSTNVYIQSKRNAELSLLADKSLKSVNKRYLFLFYLNELLFPAQGFIVLGT